MASRFTVDLLVEAYGARRGGEVDAGDLLDELLEWAPSLADETLAPPRIVLLAEDFGPVMTNTVIYLIEQGLDLRLVRVQLYRLGGDTLALSATQLLPVPDAEDFMVRPRSAPLTQQATRDAVARRAPIPQRLVAAEVFDEGQELRVVVPAGVQEDRVVITQWLEEDVQRASVRWRQDPRAPVEWAIDSRAWNLTTLIRNIVEQATGAPPRTQVWGPNWYQTLDGLVLHKVAESLGDSGAGSSRFDWSMLHALLLALPNGRWSTYGDLAEVVGTGALAVGSHIAGCDQCANVWRVLGIDGRSRPNYASHDSADQRTQEQLLMTEGVAFVRGSADPSYRLRAEELESLVG